MTLSVEDLRILGLELSDLENCPEDVQRKIIRQQWGQLCLRYHPDKNFGDNTAAAKFVAITQAYNRLVKEGTSTEYIEEINRFFTTQDVMIPETAFDLLMQESIIEKYAELKQIFTALESHDEKMEFGMRYGAFLNLAQSLENMQDGLNQQRADYLFKQENALLIERITQAWRQLIIRLFAEEYLDDFQYRRALATGELYSILAIRKLVSPIKHVVALVNSIIILLTLSVSYLLKQCSISISEQFMQEYAAYQAGALNAVNIIKIAIQIIGLVLLSILPFCFVPVITFYAIGLPMIALLLELIACPINKIIRPIASYAGLSPTILSVLFSIAGAAALLALVNTTTLAGGIVILDYAVLALYLYCLYGLIKLVYNMYNLHPALGILQGTMVALNVALAFILPLPPVDVTQSINLIGVLLSSLTSASIFYYANYVLENIRIAMSAIIEVLPLPEEDIPEEIIKATLLGNPTALHSHRIFNTPNDAEVIVPEERTFRQYTSSFFGGGAKDSKKQQPHFRGQTAAPSLLMEVSP